MKIVSLKHYNHKILTRLFCECFEDNGYYQRLFEKETDKAKAMAEKFARSISFCAESGYSFGIEDKGALIALMLCFDYGKTKKESTADFFDIFGCAATAEDTDLPYFEQLHKELLSATHKTLYMLSIAVKKQYRGEGIASLLVDKLIKENTGCDIVSDVSNEGSLAIYVHRGFNCEKIEEGYFKVFRKGGKTFGEIADFDRIKLAVADMKLLEKTGGKYRLIKERCAIYGIRRCENKDYTYFVECSGDSVEFVQLAEMPYKTLLLYQRGLAVTQSIENYAGDIVYYTQKNAPCRLLNSTLEEMLKTRQAEWALVPDIYVSVPVRYCDAQIFEQFAKAKNSPIAKDNTDYLLEQMKFRSHYEAGVPSCEDGVDDLSGFKMRIKRYNLGQVKLKLLTEMSCDDYLTSSEQIGGAITANIFISLDMNSNCAVLGCYFLSAPFLVSQYMDNVISNRIVAVTDDKEQNLFDWLNSRFGIVKRGSSKFFVIIPEEKQCLSKSALASLLASETIYPEGENFGRIIDADITSVLNSAYGMGQYDRGYVYAYTNVVLELSSECKGTMKERLAEAAITLFYMELVLFEEAAIQSADRAMIGLLSSDSTANTVEFLKLADKIFDNYSKTVEFWEIQVNYPTSQKSIDMLRRAFQLEKQLQFMQRNKEQLQLVFDTKCDLIDRSEIERTNKSLAILSVFAVFSAWVDSYDFVATWNNTLSAKTVAFLQKSLFYLILIAAVYIVTHLFHFRGRNRK